MAEAVRCGAAGHAAAVAAELLLEGHQELLADVAAHLASTGAAGWLLACAAKACKFGDVHTCMEAAPDHPQTLRCSEPLRAGHASELAQLSAAALQLEHSKVSLPELAGLLNRAVGEYSSGGAEGGPPARAIARAARHPPEQGLKQLSPTAVAAPAEIE